VTVKRLSVHVLHEYDIAYRPHASSYLRLLRPLSHPALRKEIELTYGLTYDQQDVDVVVFDRFWRPDVTRAKVTKVVDCARRAGAKVVYSVDDDLLNMPARSTRVGRDLVVWPTDDHRQAMAFLLSQADALWVTTERLRERYRSRNANITVLPNCLDERLLSRPTQEPSWEAGARQVIGFMGTPTHDADLRMVLPALREICDRYRDSVVLEIIGGFADSETTRDLAGLPVRYRTTLPTDHEYPYFMMWYTRSAHWDIGLAPLVDSDFNACKSDIKLLDYAAVGAASVCSRVPAYESTVEHRLRGMLVGNHADAWVTALDELLGNDCLRQSIAAEAAVYLHSQRTLAQGARAWVSALRSLCDRADME